jgi:hypothetical protein
MAKAMRRIREHLRSIDIVVEVVDARIARSGRNPLLDELAGARTRLVVLDRNDLADPATTKRWLAELVAARLRGRCGGRAKSAQRRPDRRCDRPLAGREDDRDRSRDDRWNSQLRQILHRQRAPAQSRC